VLVVSFGVALAIRWFAQRVMLTLVSGRPRWARRPIDLSIKRCIDPFGMVAAALGGVGWGSAFPEDPRRGAGRGRYAAAVLAGPLAVLGLGALGVVAYRLQGGSPEVLRNLSVPSVLHGEVTGLSAAQSVALLFAVTCVSFGLLALLPLPPLDGGRVLFAVAPRTIGWQRAAYRLQEQNWGVLVLLALLLLPLGQEGPLLLVIVDAAASPLLALGA
jgi:Zn-dependent protease